MPMSGRLEHAQQVFYELTKKAPDSENYVSFITAYYWSGGTGKGVEAWEYSFRTSNAEWYWYFEKTTLLPEREVEHFSKPKNRANYIKQTLNGLSVYTWRFNAQGKIIDSGG